MNNLKRSIHLAPWQAASAALGEVAQRALFHHSAEKGTLEALKNDLQGWVEEAPAPEWASRLEARRRIERCFGNGEKKLELSHLSLSNLPEALGRMRQLERLDILNAGLQSLPKELGELSRLKYLHLGGNDLVELPAELGRLKKLRHLFLNANQLAALPSCLGELEQLELLHVSHNRLAELPPVLRKLHQLTDLDAHHNQITALPDWLLRMNLRYLDVASNPIANLSDFAQENHRLRALINSQDPALAPHIATRWAKVFSGDEGQLSGDSVVLKVGE